MTTNSELTRSAPRTPEATLREVIGTLAPIERAAGSEGERRAAEWIAGRLSAAGAPARIEEAKFRGDFAGVVAALSAAGAAAGIAATTRRGRRLGAIAGAAVAGLIADDISNGARPFRRLTRPERTTWNVIAEAGDRDAERTIVVLAHHDAAQTGFIFDPRFQEGLIDRFPGIVERIDTSLPLWWPVLAGPLLATAGGLSGRKGLARAGALISAGAAATMTDIQRGATVPGANDNLTAVAVIVALAGALISAGAAATMTDIQRGATVPGANDNLTAVAVIVALAEALAADPVEGLRVELVSVGAEEVLQGGIYDYCERHLAGRDRERTFFLNVETVGGPSLALLEGEGCVVMEDYFDRPFRDLIGRVAERGGIPLRRGMRSRTSTDSVLPSRMGVPTATVVAINRYKALSNYHRMTDTPENICWPTVACAADLAEGVVRELAPPAGTASD